VPALTFCDFSTFYAPTAGGIRTYHDAKLAWFSRQAHHRYVLVYPADTYSVIRLSPSATVVTVYGVPVRAGYRIPLDLGRVRALVRDMRPDVLETGDPWFSGPFGLWFKQAGFVRGAVSSFFHGDPLRTYVDPWVARATRWRGLRRCMGERADRWFYRVQQMYDLTLASSAGAERALRAGDVRNVLRVGFGVDRRFLAVGRARRPTCGHGTGMRLLYAGRLQSDKGVDLLLAAIPELLRRADVTLTIVGRGPLADVIARLTHPRVTYLGHISSREELAAVYARHDILLAPGPHETFGLAVLEGIAAGLTVVGPSAAGTGELMSQLTAPCLFAPDHRESFVAAVDAAMNGDRTAQLEDGLGLAERYGSWDDAVARQVEAYCGYLSRSTT
jgi:alpha-1,6-mannosyltransferase